MGKLRTFLLEKVNDREHSFLKFAACFGVIFVLSILVRLPHFLSKNFWFDGDEAIIGIMAQDLLAGTRFPFYFYGQNYGLSTFEVLSTAAFEAVLGPGTWTLRLGGLFLFSLGITFVIRSLRGYSLPRWLMISLAVLMVSFPTWYLWGSMVRGGYVTAFLFVSVIFYCIFRMKPSRWQLFWIGAAAAIAFESHFLILLSFIPILAWWLFGQERYWKKIAFILTVFIAVVALFRFFGYVDTVFWEAPNATFGWSRQWHNLSVQIDGFMAGFSSFSHFEMNIERPAWWNVLLCIFLLVSILYLFIDFLQSSFRKRVYYGVVLGVTLVYLFVISIAATASPRYWIGLFTGMLFWMIFAAITNRENNTPGFFIGIVSLLSLMGIFSGSKMKQHWLDAGVNEQTAFRGLYDEIRRHDVKALFVTDNFIQYQWNYLYGREIPASAFRQRERTQEFCDQVNEWYSNEPERVALAGLWGIFLTMDYVEGFNDYRYQVETKYFLNLNARKDFVEKGMKYILERGG